MIDVSNAKWDLSNSEKFAIKWLEENGYDGKIIKQYISKTIFEVSKDDVTDKFELAQGIKFGSIETYMEMFKKSWKMLCKLNGTEKEKNNDVH